MDPSEIDRLLSSWSFAVEETSAGVYRVRGLYEAGWSVEASGADPDATLAKCRLDAARITRDKQMAE